MAAPNILAVVVHVRVMMGQQQNPKAPAQCK